LQVRPVEEQCLVSTMRHDVIDVVGQSAAVRAAERLFLPDLIA
jgi:hypothetical protein